MAADIAKYLNYYDCYKLLTRSKQKDAKGAKQTLIDSESDDSEEGDDWDVDDESTKQSENKQSEKKQKQKQKQPRVGPLI